MAKLAAALLLLAAPAFADDQIYLDIVRCKAMSETASARGIPGWEDLLNRAAALAPDVDAAKVAAAEEAGTKEGAFVAEMAVEPDPGFFQIFRISRIAGRCDTAVERLAALETTEN